MSSSAPSASGDEEKNESADRHDPRGYGCALLIKGDTRGALYQPHLVGQTPAIVFMTLAELYQWALLRNWGAERQARLEAYLQDYVVLPYEPALCRWWAWASVQARRNGHRMETADGWIAAAALLYNVPLLTHNPSDYAGVPDLALISGA